MAQTLQNILQDIGAIVDQDTTLPTGTDLTVRTTLINQAIRTWGDSYQWKQLRVNQYAIPLTTSQTSMALPSNFKKLMSRPFNVSLTTNNDYEEIRPEDSYIRKFNDVNSRYCFTGGDEAAGKYLVINPAMASGASLVFDYQSFPSGLATYADISQVHGAGYVYKTVVSKIFESRSDPRFPTFKQEAEDSLANMIDEEAALSGAFTNKTRNYLDSMSFRIGDN